MSVEESRLTATAAQRQSQLLRLVRELLVLLLGTVFLALLAQVSISLLPFTPVPITGQTLGVLLIGALYGPWRGALCLLAYLGEGAAGLPVFAGGASGAATLIGPTGGYLIAFPVAAAIVGLLVQPLRGRTVRLAGAPGPAHWHGRHLPRRCAGAGVEHGHGLANGHHQGHAALHPRRSDQGRGGCGGAAFGYDRPAFPGLAAPRTGGQRR